MRLSILLASTIVLSSAQLMAQAPSTTPAGDSENGKKLYVQHGCFQCHNYEAQGGSAGPRLANRTRVWAAFSRYMRRPTGQMPPYTEKVMPDQDLADVFAWIRSIPAPPPVSSIPQLKGRPKS